MSHIRARAVRGHHEDGAVLIVGLIILLAMTMLGLTAMQGTSLQERMAGNVRDRSVAFQTAEIALRAGEKAVFSGPPSTSEDGVFDIQTAPAPQETDNSAWDDGSSSNYKKFADLPTSGGSDAFPALAEAPKYWIEARPGRSLSAEASTPRETVYTITARATGANKATTVILQSNARN